MSPKRAIGILLTATLILSGSVASAKKKKQPTSDVRRGATRRRAAAGRSAVEGARARVQAVRRRGLLLVVDRALQGHRGRVGRHRAEQAEGRVLDGQGPLQHEVLLGVAVVLRSDRAEGPVARLLQRDAEVAGVALAPAAGLDGHPREDRQVQPRRARSAGAREGARRALLPARQVLLPEGAVQGGGRAVPGRPRQQRLLRARPSCSRARRTSASTRPSRPSRRSRRSCGPRRRARTRRSSPTRTSPTCRWRARSTRPASTTWR